MKNHGTSPSVSEGFIAAHDKTKISGEAIFNCLPVIIFAYMYQPNIPAIYSELEEKNTMNKVLAIGTLGPSFLYIMVGIFGFVAFAAVGPNGYPFDTSINPPVQWNFDRIFVIQNILAAPYQLQDGRTPVAI